MTCVASGVGENDGADVGEFEGDATGDRVGWACGDTVGDDEGGHVANVDQILPRNLAGGWNTSTIERGKSGIHKLISCHHKEKWEERQNKRVS